MLFYSFCAALDQMTHELLPVRSSSRSQTQPLQISSFLCQFITYKERVHTATQPDCIMTIGLVHSTHFIHLWMYGNVCLKCFSAILFVT